MSRVLLTVGLLVLGLMILGIILAPLHEQPVPIQVFQTPTPAQPAGH